MKLQRRLWRRVGAVLGAVALASGIGVLAHTTDVSAHAPIETPPDWNYYNESPLYAPSSMHQGHYSLYRV